MITIDKVKELISAQLNKPIDEILEEKEVVKDLGADSLDVVEMLMSLEEEFGISVDEDKAATIRTVADVVALIENN